MNINNIHFSNKFPKLLVKLPKEVQDKTYQKINLFVQNPLHPSLRLHKLTGKLVGYRSISIDMSHRIILQMKDNDDVLLITVGNHSIYQKR